MIYILIFAFYARLCSKIPQIIKAGIKKAQARILIKPSLSYGKPVPVPVLKPLIFA